MLFAFSKILLIATHTYFSHTHNMSQKRSLILPAGVIFLLLAMTATGLLYTRPNQYSFTLQTFTPPPLDLNFSSLEICPIDLSLNGRLDFVLLTQNTKNADKPSPIILYRNMGVNSWQIEVRNDITFIHPRNCLTGDFNGDGFPDLAIADHGYDHPPYDGGQPQILLSDKNGQLKKAGSAFFFTTPVFNFNVAVADFNSDQKDDLLLLNITQSPPQLFLNSNHQKLTEHSERLPDFVRTLQKKFLGVVATDINQDGFVDLVLGGHGGKQPNENFERDVVLFGSQGGAFQELLPEIFPARRNGAELSSVELVQADFSGDSYPDIAVLYHTVGLMTDGYVDFFENQSGRSFRRLLLSKEFKNHPESIFGFHGLSPIASRTRTQMI